jgi:hypothetical protein
MSRPAKYDYSEANRLILARRSTDAEIAEITGIPKNSIARRRRAIEKIKAAEVIEETIAITEPTAIEDDTLRDLDQRLKIDRSLTPLTLGLINRVATRFRDARPMDAVEMQQIATTVARVAQINRDMHGDDEYLVIVLIRTGLVTRETGANIFAALERSQRQFQSAFRNLIAAQS